MSVRIEIMKFNKAIEKYSEAKMRKFKVDTLAGSESDKLIELLDSENIKYKKRGSIFEFSLENSPSGSVLKSYIEKQIKFDYV